MDEKSEVFNELKDILAKVFNIPYYNNLGNRLESYHGYSDYIKYLELKRINQIVKDALKKVECEIQSEKKKSDE